MIIKLFFKSVVQGECVGFQANEDDIELPDCSSGGSNDSGTGGV